MPSNGTPQSYSERHSTYLDFTKNISRKDASLVLFTLLGVLILGEVAFRVFPPHYPRTAISSLHGYRTIFQEAVENPGNGIVAVGDSTLVGGGVSDDSQIVMGRMQSAIGKNYRIYNLALPGGDNTTSLITLDALRRAHVKKLDRVIIETIPSKFSVDIPPKRVANAGTGTMDDILHYCPYANPGAWGFKNKLQSAPDRVETWVEYGLGNVSMLYRNRDFFRTRVMGNYPVFWLAGAALPHRLKEKLVGTKANGTNRFGARLDDHDFDPATAEPPMVGWRYDMQGQERYLNESIKVAKAISKNPPIVVLFPTHYEYDKLTPAQTAQYDTRLDALYAYVTKTFTASGAKVIVVNSQQMQDPSLWTRTKAHFNREGGKRVWEAMKPTVCTMYKCD